MKHDLLILSAVFLSALFFNSCQKEEKEVPLTLTVEQVLFNSSSSGLSLKSVMVTDENGNEVVFSTNPSNWFENANIQTMTIPEGASFSLGIIAGEFRYTLLSKVKLNVTVGGKVYAVGFGPQSKFVVLKTKNGKYDLLPEETVRLSPAPF